MAKKASLPFAKQVEIVEVGNNRFVPYVWVEVTIQQDEAEDVALIKNMLGTDSLFSIAEGFKRKYFRTEEDLEVYLTWVTSDDRFKPRHLFYNLNRYGAQLNPKDGGYYIDIFMKSIGCESEDMSARMFYTIEYAARTPCPLIFYREYIAEFTLLVYIVYMHIFSKLEFDLQLEDGTYIPYLVCNGKSHFVLASLYEDLLIDHNTEHVAELIEFGLVKLRRNCGN